MSRPSRRAQKLATAITAATVMLALSACGNGAAGGGRVSFSKDASGSLNAWAFDSADDVGKARLAYADDLLKKDQVTVTLDQTAFDAQKFATRTASGRVPDVVQMSSQYVTTYAAQGLIVPLDQCYSLYGVKPSSYFYPQVAADVTYRKQIWGVPQFYQPPAILLDKRVTQASGVTAADLDLSDQSRVIAAAKKMTRFDGDTPTRIGFDPQGPAKAGLWMLSFGGRLTDASGKPALDNANNAKAIDFLKKLYDAQGGYAKDKSLIDSFDVFGDGNEFVKDQVGAAIFDQWYVNVLSGYADQVSLSATPFRDQKGDPFTVASGQAFVIPAKAKNRSAACRWMIDVTSKGSWDAAAAARQKTLDTTPGAINTGLFTGVQSVDQAIKKKYTGAGDNADFEQVVDTYYSIADNGKSFGSSPAGQQIGTELTSAVTAVLTGEKSSRDALSDAQKAAMSAYTRATR